MKRKLVNKILAIALSAAMAVTALPQTNAWATEIEEIQITEGDTIATDKPEQTEADVDSADAESEACQEGDIDIQTAVSENQLPAEIVPDENAVEDETNDNISAETVGDGSKENPYVIKEGEETELHFSRVVEEYDDDSEVHIQAYVSFTPSTTGIYRYSFAGPNAIYGNNIHCIISNGNKEIFMKAGETYNIKFTYYSQEEEFDIVLKLNQEEVWNLGENITLEGAKNNVSIKKNTVYPIIFSKPGIYEISITDSNKKEYLKIFNENYYSIGLSDNATTVTNMSVPSTKTIYIYSQVDNILNFSYTQYETVKEEEYNKNAIWVQPPNYYLFTPSVTGDYYLDAFCSIDSWNSIASFEKGKTYILEYECDYENPIIWNLGKSAEEMDLGENTLSDAAVSRFSYSCDKDTELLLSFPDGVDWTPIIYNDNGWSEKEINQSVVSCKKGDTLYVLIYNENSIPDNFYIREIAYQTEDFVLNAEEENKISSSTKKVFFYMLPKDLEYGLYQITISGASAQTECGLLRKNSMSAEIVNMQEIVDNYISDLFLCDYQYLMLYERDGTKKDYTLEINKSKLPALSDGDNLVDISAGKCYCELSVSESGWYQILDAGLYTTDDNYAASTQNSYYWCSIYGEENVMDEGLDHSYYQKVFCYLDKNKKYIVSFEDYDSKKRSFSVNKINELEFNQDNWIKTSIMFTKPNGVECYEIIAPETGYLISYSDEINSISVYDYNNKSYRPEKKTLLEKGNTYKVEFCTKFDSSMQDNFVATGKYVQLYIDTVTYKNEQKAAAVAEQIKAIGAVTLDKKEAIEKARAAYNALSDDAKKYVSDADLKLLTDAEVTYGQLKAAKEAAEEAAKKSAEEAAAKAAAEEAAKKAAAEAAAAEAAKKEAVGAENVVGDATYVVAENQTVIYKAPSKKDATSVKIPETIQINGKDFAVTEIAADAFKNNKKLTKVTVPKNIKVIGKNAFRNCSALKTVTIGSSVTILTS